MVAVVTVLVPATSSGASGNTSSALQPLQLAAGAEPGPTTAPQTLPNVVGTAFATTQSGWLVQTVNPVTDKGASLVARTEILGTADGGDHWALRWNGTGSPGGIVAAGPRTAFVIMHKWGSCTAANDAPECASTLLSTTDGGLSWHEVWASPLLMSQVAFSGSTLGVGALVPKPCSESLSASGRPAAACPGELVRTTDGGHQWAAVLRTPGPIVAVASGGAELWWAVQSVIGFGYSPPGGRLLVWASSNGGTTWARRGQMSGSGLQVVTPRAVGTVTVASPGGLWLSLIDWNACAMHGCATLGAWYSGDGGRTWSKRTCPQ